MRISSSSCCWLDLVLADSIIVVTFLVSCNLGSSAVGPIACIGLQFGAASEREVAKKGAKGVAQTVPKGEGAIGIASSSLNLEHSVLYL